MSIPNVLNKDKENLEKKYIESLEEQIEEIIQENPNLNCSRNGFRTKIVNTLVGTINMMIPRFRHLTFDYELLESQLLDEMISNLCVSMYGHGLSDRRIADIFQSINIKISKSKVSELCKVLQNNVDNYFQTDLSDYDFEIIHIDGKYYRVKDVNKTRKSVLLSVIGIASNGERIHLHMNVHPSEDKQYIEQFLYSLKSRIGNTNACFVIDGNNNLPQTIGNIFPEAKVQRCLSHVVRNIESSLKPVAGINQTKVIINELKEILFYTDNYNIENKLKEYIHSYEQYNYIFKNHLNSDYIWTFTKIDTFMDCKTNNNIEGFHSQLEMVTSQHNSFATSDSLFRAIINEIERYNKLDNCANELNKASKLHFDIKDVIKPQNKKDLITLTVTYNGRKRLNMRITKLQYDAIRELVQME